MHINIYVLTAFIIGSLFGVASIARWGWLHNNWNLVQEGDIVLYVNPNDRDHDDRNLVTQVLSTMPRSGTAIIRGAGTTTVVPLRCLQVLNPDRGFPLRIPKEPTVIQCGHENNKAGFQSIPLNWFGYDALVERKAA